MLSQVSKLALIPILALSVAPTAAAATPPANATVIAQMTQVYCTATAPYGSIGVTVYDSPNGSVIGRLQDGSSVLFNLSDRSGLWAEVSGEDGTAGWVEAEWLACGDYTDDYSDDYSEAPSEVYDQSYEEFDQEYYEEPEADYEESF